MIIISKDKDVWNFNNLSMIFVNDDDMGRRKKIFEIATSGIGSEEYVLGQYLTKKRAKEILNDIFTAYLNKEEKFEMPKE